MSKARVEAPVAAADSAPAAPAAAAAGDDADEMEEDDPFAAAVQQHMARKLAAQAGLDSLF